MNEIEKSLTFITCDISRTFNLLRLGLLWGTIFIERPLSPYTYKKDKATWKTRQAKGFFSFFLFHPNRCASNAIAFKIDGVYFIMIIFLSTNHNDSRFLLGIDIIFLAINHNNNRFYPFSENLDEHYLPQLYNKYCQS